MAENNENDRITNEQIRQLKRIETIRKLRGVPGYKDAFAYLLSGFMEQEGLTEKDLTEAEPPDPDVVGEMTVGDRTYEILNFLCGNKSAMGAFTMTLHARNIKANLGEEEGRYIIEHKDDIPPGIFLRFKYFVCTDWKEPWDASRIAWFGKPYGKFEQGFGDIYSADWSEGFVLRRKA